MVTIWNKGCKAVRHVTRVKCNVGTYVGLPHIKCGINPNKEQVQQHGSLNIMCKQHWNMDIIIMRG